MSELFLGFSLSFEIFKRLWESFDVFVLSLKSRCSKGKSHAYNSEEGGRCSNIIMELVLNKA